VCADVRHDLTRTHVGELDALDLAQVRGLYDQLLAEAVLLLDADGVDPERRRFMLSADVRYQGQNYHLNLPVSERELEGGLATLPVRFHEQHRRVYGYELSARSLQLVNARVTAVGLTTAAHWPQAEGEVGDEAAAVAAPAEMRRILLANGQYATAPVYRLLALRPDCVLDGPAIVEYPGATLYLAPGWQCRLDAMRNAHLVHHRTLEPHDVATDAAHLKQDHAHA
jgi:N-methylhydantoinase A